MKRLQLIRLKLDELQPWLAGVGVALGVSWLADSLRDVVEFWFTGKNVRASFASAALVISFAFFRGVKMKKTRILWHFYHFSAHRYRATECRKLLYC